MAKKMNALLAMPTGDVDFQDIKAQINAVRKSLSFLTSLTDEQMAAMNKISDGAKVYIADCLVEAANAKDLLPAYFNVEDIRNDNQLNDSLYELEDIVFDLYQDLKRNRMAAADRAYSGVASFYSLVKTAADANVPQARAIFNRLQDFHQKKVNTGKARKRKQENAIAAKAVQAASTN